MAHCCLSPLIPSLDVAHCQPHVEAGPEMGHTLASGFPLTEITLLTIANRFRRNAFRERWNVTEGLTKPSWTQKVSSRQMCLCSLEQPEGPHGKGLGLMYYHSFGKADFKPRFQAWYFHREGNVISLWWLILAFLVLGYQVFNNWYWSRRIVNLRPPGLPSKTLAVWKT